ncbi:MAG: stage IV sporulation protein A [Clostridia bacterium]|nr:stage IV sporulation protein A [Clostridia bacterium]
MDINIYNDMAKRTGGEIFVGVVGPVRTGKSTFIKGVMEQIMLPNITDEFDAKRARDEMPQSAAGRTVMTAEPKFIPDEAVSVTLADGASFKMRIVDCVGFIVEGAGGLSEDGQPRMVKTPWSEQEMSFEEAAMIGTKKVIADHSTVAVLVTCDGSFGDIPRENYISAEELAVKELKAEGKPFCIIVNSADPSSEKAEALALSLEERYSAPVALIDCAHVDREDIDNIFMMILDEFPIRELNVDFPGWVSALPHSHRLFSSFTGTVRACAEEIGNMGDVKTIFEKAKMNPDIGDVQISSLDMSNGVASVYLSPQEDAYYSTLSELTGIEALNEDNLFTAVCELAEIKRKYDKVKEALDDVNEKGYGIVMPDISDLVLEEPEIVRQSGGYGVRLRASARSVHMIKANIETEINPIVGTEQQSEELISYLTREFEENPTMIWSTDLLGKSLNELVNEGLRSKLQNMPDESRTKLSETLEKIINEGSGGLICIIL